MNQSFQHYEATRVSLRETMVPLENWFRYVQAFESCGPLKLLTENGNNFRGTGLYTVMYPYLEPAWVSILRNRFPGRTRFSASELSYITPGELDWWNHEVINRTSHYPKTAIPGEFVGMIDGNYDYGCILHLISGVSYPFDYSKVDTFEVTAMPVTLTGWLMWKMNLFGEMNPLEQTLLMRFLSDNQDGFEIFYRPIFNSKDGDAFHSDGSSVFMTRNAKATEYEVNKICECLHAMFRAHAKCIILP